MISIKSIEKENRPREKLMREGVESLNNEELIAILIGSGTKNNSVFDISRSLLNKYGSFTSLLNADVYSLMEIEGLKEAKANLFIVIGELIKRANKEKIHFSKSYKDAGDIYDLVKVYLEQEKQEKFIVIYLNVKLQIIKQEVLFKGGADMAYIDINMIFKHAILCGAKSIICVHNHPTGDSSPSDNDIQLTNSIKKISNIVKIPLLDHIIIGKREYFSFSKLWK